MKYSVVVPVFGNEATLPELLRQLAQLHGADARVSEVVFVIDGSPDHSYALLKRQLPDMPFASQLVCLSRNFGSFAAIRAGLSLARGDYVAFLAADLQQPVSTVPQFFSALERGADIVIGQRASRSDPWRSRMAATVFWAVYRRLVQSDVPHGGVDAFACTRQVRDILVALPEANSTLIGLLFWVGFRRELIAYPRQVRPAGRSGWTRGRKLRYALDTALAFSDLPITAMIAAGALGACASLIAATAALIAGSSGNTLLLLLVLFSLSVMLLSIGIVGGYVWRVFENTKGRPAHILRSVERIEPVVHLRASGGGA